MKIPKKPLKPTPRKRLRASAQSAKYADDDYGADEPNVKLSRAFVVVLLLHVVAVGGIFAFSALKDRQTTSAKNDPAGQKSTTAQSGGAQIGPALKPISSEAQKLMEGSQSAAAGAGKQAGNANENGEGSEKVYIVQKGDSPAGIAKKFKVSYENLLKTNNIDNPKKLQIGQKLLIPIVNR